MIPRWDYQEILRSFVTSVFRSLRSLLDGRVSHLWLAAATLEATSGAESDPAVGVRALASSDLHLNVLLAPV